MTGIEIRKLSINLMTAVSVLVSAVGLTWYVAGEFSKISNEIAELRLFIADNTVSDSEFQTLEARVRAAEIAIAGVHNVP
jgi:hypothetical protein